MDMESHDAQKGDNKDFLQNLADNRNGWIICVVCILINFVRSGINYTFGLYIAEFKRLYQSPMAELNWISVTCTCLSFSFSLMPSLVIKKWPKNGYMISSLIGTLLQTGSCLSSSFVDHTPWLFLTFGIMFGIGSSFTMMAGSLILGEFFPKVHAYHEFATSIYQCAFPAGLLVFSPIYAWLIDVVNWRWSLRIAGAVSFVIGIACSFLLLLKRPNFEDLNNNAERPLNCRYYLDIFRMPERIFWVTGMALIFASQLVVVNNLPHYMEERGFQVVESSMSLVTMGIFELFMYIAVPFLGKRFKGNLVYVNIISSMACAIIFVIWPSANPSYTTIMSLSAGIGVFGALSFIFIYPGSGEAMDMDLNEAWTISCLFCGIGALFGPLISGIVYDFTNSYDNVFHAAAAVSLFNGFVFLGVPLTKYYRKYRYERLD